MENQTENVESVETVMPEAEKPVEETTAADTEAEQVD